MRIAIIDIDRTRMPNLALAKVAKYHTDRADRVLWNPLPLWAATADRVYVSCVFEKNRGLAAGWEGLAEIGGSGYSLSKRLPPEIEAVKPRINLGFAVRGCIRHCPFCIVPQKEGPPRIVGDLLDLWDGSSKVITLLDNNILAVPEHFRKICQQAREKGIRVDFNQGLDHRLLTEDIAGELKTIRHREYRFSFDNIAYLPSVRRALGIIKKAGLGVTFWYVLVGFDSTFAEDYERVMFLRERGQTVFIQRFKKTPGNMLLARWVNQIPIFKGMSFEQFLTLPRNAKFYRKYRDEIEGYFDGNKGVR